MGDGKARSHYRKDWVRKLNSLGEGRVTTLLDHEFLKESYDWQSHATVLCVHTSHCSAATARTHRQTNAHSDSVVSFGCLCNKKTIKYEVW